MVPRKLTVIFLLAAALISGFPGLADGKVENRSTSEMELRVAIKEIFDSRASALITGADPAPALSCYDTTDRLGLWALEHEKAKLNYTRLWAEKRGVVITEAGSALQIPWMGVYGDTAELVVYQTLKLGYNYPGDPAVNLFGIGTRHWMKLVRKDGKWLIVQDFYTDGLGDNIQALDPVPADGPAIVEPLETPAPEQNDSPGAFDREGAVRYADKYAGLAWGAGNDNNYNPRYRDFNNRGGDCTNFVSQCLGDPEGGKMPMDYIWFYDKKDNSASQAWARAETFGDWLLYTGRGRRVERGTFQELNQPTPKFPKGAVRELQKGDVIGYGERSYSEHLAIVVGSDSRGYPLVNAHNVDRYHCPWDMGFDKDTVFHLYKIK
ncbi:MAG TPA: amidase domain-containing protein [Bacillota bacterium]|nr:amidase domain-containing protein [Bacillota bacterium]